MTFFSRPNLDDVQFKQLTGSTLTLDGKTVINSVSGLSLSGDYGKIPIVVTGETNNYVLTYDDVENVIKLKEPTASGGTGIYPYNESATTTVGGLISGTNLYNVAVVDILQEILVPTLSPTLTPNSSTFSLLPSSTIYEVGCQINLSGCSTYNQGSVSPVYCGGPSVRTGLPTSYNYVDANGDVCNVSTSSLNNKTGFASRTISVGVNTTSASISYSAGDYPRKSDGSCVLSCCPAATTTATQRNVCGIYPYFWGYSATTPTIGQTLINVANTAGQKCVGLTLNDVVVSNYCVTGQYIWLAIPVTGSIAKTKWQGGNSPSNCGTIPGDLFSSEVTSVVNSPNSCWSGINYRFYVSNYPTSIDYSMTFKNS